MNNDNKIKELKKEVIKSDVDLLFSERLKLEKRFLKWAKKHNAEVCPLNVITWLLNQIKRKRLSLVEKIPRKSLEEYDKQVNKVLKEKNNKIKELEKEIEDKNKWIHTYQVNMEGLHKRANKIEDENQQLKSKLKQQRKKIEDRIEEFKKLYPFNNSVIKANIDIILSALKEQGRSEVEDFIFDIWREIGEELQNLLKEGLNNEK